jgi:hypothetical protein
MGQRFLVLWCFFRFAEWCSWKAILLYEGVRHGDPLCPLLYVLGGDLLQSAVNDLLREGGIRLTLRTRDDDFPIIQYVDGTLLIMPANLDLVLDLKAVLQVYSESEDFNIVRVSDTSQMYL